MKQIILQGVNLDELLEKIGQLIESKIEENISQPKKENQSKFISRKEAATLLQISLPTLNDWTKEGLLKSYLIGTKVLYKPEEVEQSVRHRNFNKFKKGGNHGA